MIIKKKRHPRRKLSQRRTQKHLNEYFINTQEAIRVCAENQEKIIETVSGLIHNQEVLKDCLEEWFKLIKQI